MGLVFIEIQLRNLSNRELAVNPNNLNIALGLCRIKKLQLFLIFKQIIFFSKHN